MDQYIVLGIILVVFVAFVVIGLDYIVPVYIKMSMNDICRDYALILAANGTLEESEKQAIKTNIEALGVETVFITISGDHFKQGDMIDFGVEGTYKGGFLDSLFKRSERDYQFTFKDKITYRRIWNH